MELKGYRILKKHYKVPSMVLKDYNNKIVMYEYNESNQENAGLLVDYFSTHDALSKQYYRILNIYISIFNKTINYEKKGNCKIFFEKRLKTRLKNNIDYVLENNFNGKEYFINNRKVTIKLPDIYNELHRYFNKLGNEWCVISNCDPNDLNICIDTTMFDYTGGGYVPLIAEFAVFTCYNLIQAEYLALKYNKTAFKHHKNIFKHLNQFQADKSTLQHHPRKIRIDAVEVYARQVVNPLINKVNYKNWYGDFKYYFIMKLLAVFQFKKMSKKDVILSLAYAQLFYDADFESIEDLIIFIKKIYE